MIWFGIFILSMVCLSVITHTLRYFKVCKVGFHDMVTVETIGAVDLFKQVAGDEATNFNPDRSIYSIYGHNFVVDFRNKACIKCGECDNGIDKATNRIEKYITQRVKERKEEEKRVQIATDLYNLNCKE